MVYDAQKYRQMRPKVVSGEMEVPVTEIWIMLYDVSYSIGDHSEEEAYRHLREDAAVLLKMLLQKLDLDEDEEADIFYEAIETVLNYLKPGVVFDMLKEAQISFTELMYRRGDLTNVRDFLIERRFSMELLEKMAQFGVDLNAALIKGSRLHIGGQVFRGQE